MIFRWFRKLARRRRERSRVFDAKFLWPYLAAQSDFQFEDFIEAATTHMVWDDAWFGFDEEWIDTDVSPWRWWEHPDRALLPAH